MLLQILKLMGLVVLQNASFTLVSRARNSSSIIYHGLAAVLSNGIWILVIRQVVIHYDSWQLMSAYVVAAVIGSISMHYIAMKYFEKPKKEKNSTISVLKEQIRITKVIKEIAVKGQDFNFAAITRDHEKRLTEQLEQITST